MLSPFTPTSLPSPRSSPKPDSTRPIVKPVKPSDRLSVEIPPFRGNVNIQSGPSHQYISPVYSNGTGHNKWKDELTLPEVKVVSRSRLRLVHCQWADEGEKKCDATLASYNLFRKHVKRHYVKSQQAAIRNVEPGETVPTIRCGWKDCEWSTRKGSTFLDIHVQHAHLKDVLESYCPFKDCFHPGMSVEEYRSGHHFHNPIGHSHPWTLDSLRIDPTKPQRYKPRPLPPLPKTALVDPFLAHSQPYSNTQLRHRRKNNPQPLLSDLQHSITPLPIHREDYFCVNGTDAPCGIFGSSVFFPHPDTHLPDRVLYKEDGTYVRLKNGKKVDIRVIWRLMRGDPVSKSATLRVDQPGVSGLPSVHSMGQMRNLEAQKSAVQPAERSLGPSNGQGTGGPETDTVVVPTEERKDVMTEHTAPSSGHIAEGLGVVLDQAGEPTLTDITPGDILGEQLGVQVEKSKMDKEIIRPLDNLPPLDQCPSSTSTMIPKPISWKGYPNLSPGAGYFETIRNGSNMKKRKAANDPRPDTHQTLTDIKGEIEYIGMTDNGKSKPLQPFDQEKVERASRVYAQKRVKRSYGFDMWVERVKFMKWGHELGECELRFG